MNGQDVVHVKVHLEAGLLLCELKDRDPRSWYQHKSTLFRHVFDDLSAHPEKLELIVGKFVLYNAGDVNI